MGRRGSLLAQIKFPTLVSVADKGAIPMIRRMGLLPIVWLNLCFLCVVSPASAGDGDAADDVEKQWQAADEAVRLNPGSAMAYLARAKAWTMKGAIDSAIADLDDAIRLDPKNVRAYIGRGSMWGLKKEYDRAITELTLALNLDQNNAYALVSRGRIWHEKGDYEKALLDFNEGLRIDPKMTFALHARAMIHAANGHFDMAIDDLNAAIAVEPAYVAAIRDRGYCYYKKGELDIALEDYNAFIRARPKDANAYNNRGCVLRDKGDLDQALANFNVAINLDPNCGNTYACRACILAGRNEPDKARQDFEEAFRLVPVSSYVFRCRAEFLCSQGDYDKAVLDLNESIRLDPRDANTLSARGQIWCHKKEYQKAVTDLTAAIRLKPHDANLYRHRGYAWQCLKRYDMADDDYSEAIRMGLKDADVFAERGELRYRENADDEAMLDFDAAIRLDPKSAQSLYCRALLWHRRSEMDDLLEDVLADGSHASARAASRQKALADLDNALQIDQSRAEIYVMRAFIRHTEKRLSLALQDYSAAIALEPENAYALENRSRILSETGELQKAIDDLTALIRIVSAEEVSLEQPELLKFPSKYSAFGNFETRPKLQKPSKRDKNAGIDWLSNVFQTNPDEQDADLSSVFAGLDKPIGKLDDSDEWLGESDDAIQDGELLTELFESPVSPHDRRLAELHSRRGELREGTGEIAEAVDDFDAAVRLDRMCATAYARRARILATANDEVFRDGKQAVASATKACDLTKWKVADMIDTLAAAYAESNEFEKAVDAQTKATELAPECDKAAFNSRLQLYKLGKPCREEKKTVTASERD